MKADREKIGQRYGGAGRCWHPNQLAEELPPSPRAKKNRGHQTRAEEETSRERHFAHGSLMAVTGMLADDNDTFASVHPIFPEPK